MGLKQWRVRGCSVWISLRISLFLPYAVDPCRDAKLSRGKFHGHLHRLILGGVRGCEEGRTGLGGGGVDLGGGGTGIGLHPILSKLWKCVDTETLQHEQYFSN